MSQPQVSPLNDTLLDIYGRFQRGMALKPVWKFLGLFRCQVRITLQTVPEHWAQNIALLYTACNLERKPDDHSMCVISCVSERQLLKRTKLSC